jgi:hypothetical protein
MTANLEPLRATLQAALLATAGAGDRDTLMDTLESLAEGVQDAMVEAAGMDDGEVFVGWAGVGVAG